ncbi:MAG TPA: ArsI/CadI family heavy metal resistance metalloenzyme, partial [Tahibacter sp.]|nr:ArsI/CadI family heavy metal resistance metalloenzyme [Tahibacter sp.]
MNRFHVHLNVADLDAGIRYYTALFAAEPDVRKPDYAKWLIEDPRVNFAISTTGRTPGVDHLGIQADDEHALAELGRRLQQADAAAIAEPGALCCYARSDKFWSQDPQGTRWEAFHTHGAATTYYAPAAGDAAAAAPA